MIDYTKLDRFYTGTAKKIIRNNGEIVLNLDDKDIIESVYYKINDEIYYDINNGGLAKIQNTEGKITLIPRKVRWVLNGNSLLPIPSKEELIKRCPKKIKGRFNPKKIPSISKCR